MIMGTSYYWSTSKVHFRTSLFIIIYINELSNKLSSTVKLFADDTFLFSVVNNFNLSEFHLRQHACHHKSTICYQKQRIIIKSKSSEDLATYQTRTNIFKYSFFPILLWYRTNLALTSKSKLIQCLEIFY